MHGLNDGLIGQSPQHNSAVSNGQSTISSTNSNSILAKHIRNFQRSQSQSPPVTHQTNFRIKQNSDDSNATAVNGSGTDSEASKIKYARWKFMNSGKKKQIFKLNSQSNSIFPENSDLNVKLIANQLNRRIVLNDRQNNKKNASHRQDINSTEKIKLTRSDSINQISIPTVQIDKTSISENQFNPFSLYQMYHQNDIEFRSNRPSYFKNLEELKVKTGGQFENERRSFSSSFGKQYICCNTFDDNVRTIDFVIVYDCLFYEYGRRVLTDKIDNDRTSRIINQNSEESMSKKSNASKDSTIKNSIKLIKSGSVDPENVSIRSDTVLNRKKLARPEDNRDYNAELRRLSANDLEMIEQLDNNHDEEIEYLNTKIINTISKRSPNTISKKTIGNRTRSQDIINIIDSNADSNSSSSLNDDILKEALAENDIDDDMQQRNDNLRLNTKQRYLAECCKRFEDNLIDEGLELEYSEARFVNTDNRRIGFLKIHVPWDIVCRYAELIKLKMPIGDAIESNWRLIFNKNDPNSKGRFTAPYSKDKEYLFDIPADKRLFFSSAQRSQIVEFILKRKSFSANLNDTSFGLSKLLHERAYIAAYPLDEGFLDARRSKKLDFDNEEERIENETMTRTDRQTNLFLKENCFSPRVQLYENWSSLKNIFRPQPLDEIRNYFGVKIGLYYAFLGFYTSMLIPASIVGICCFLYGIFTVDHDVPIKQVCNKQYDHIPMCPLCNFKGCDFYYLSDTCIAMRYSYLFDNSATVFFTIFMSFWSTILLEMWKRYSSRITYRWDLSAFDTFEEFPRPEYLARLNRTEKKRLNLITKVYEPYIPFFKRHLNSLISASVVILLILVAIASVIGVIIYRVSVRAAIAKIDEKYSSIFTSTTAALINLFCILILNQVYSYISLYLTELEMPRTQSDQLAIIMVGKQFIGGVFEMFVPWVRNILKYWRLKKQDKNRSLVNMNQCESDFMLNEWNHWNIMNEYSEMILQFGFLSIFSACFSLGPVFALINNLLEIRLDAKKMITSMRRPVAQRAKNIGVWYRILDLVGKLSVISSALIIAFTSEFLPKLYHLSKHGNLNTYLNHSLSFFNASEITKIGNKDKFYKHMQHPAKHFCLYQGYRHPPGQSDKYEPTQTNYELLVIKLAFVVIFENVIASTTMLLRYLIPDIPRSLRQKMRQHAYLTNELIMSQEIKRAKQNVK